MPDSSAPRESAALSDAQYTKPENLTDHIAGGVQSATNAASSFFSSLTSGTTTSSGAPAAPSHTEGKADSLLGSAKESLGRLTGDSALTGAGQGQRAAGDAQDEAATLTGYVQDRVNDAGGFVKGQAAGAGGFVQDRVNEAGGYLQSALSSVSGGTQGNYVSGQANRVDAGVDKAVGDARSRVGQAVGSAGMQGAGDAQYASGKTQDVMAAVRENLASTADQMQGRDPALGDRPDPWRAE